MTPHSRRTCRPHTLPCLRPLWSAHGSLSAWLLAAAALLSPAPPARAGERLEPPVGCYLGFNVGMGDTVRQLTSRLELVPAVYAQFFAFPLDVPAREAL